MGGIAFLFTISNVNTEYADCLLDPIEYTKATTSQNKENPSI
jgi:hypothetical protein